ncbi:MAG: helix-turn-helix domain-containing protein [Mangrovibacterium sp.]
MSYFFVAGIVIALFLILLLAAKPNKQTPDYIFGVLLFFSAQTIFNTFWVYTGRYLQYPNTLVVGLNAPIAVAPLFYLYTKYQTHNIRFRPIDYLHLLPYIALFILYADFYGLSFNEKIERMQAYGSVALDTIRSFVAYTTGFFYFMLSLWMLLRFKKNMKSQFSNTERIQFNWLLLLIVGMLVIWLIVLITKNDNIISVAATVFVFVLGYFGITQVNAFNGTNAFAFSAPTVFETENMEIQLDGVVDAKYKSSMLSEEDANQIHTQLKRVLEKERPYLNPELTLGQLARLLEVHPNRLSEVINTKEAKTFYDLINELRIKEFLQQVVKPESRQFTFMSLAYDCGFNSKASFNRNFKRYTGSTPRAYLNNHCTSELK